MAWAGWHSGQVFWVLRERHSCFCLLACGELICLFSFFAHSRSSRLSRFDHAGSIKTNIWSAGSPVRPQEFVIRRFFSSFIYFHLPQDSTSFFRLLVKNGFPILDLAGFLAVGSRHAQKMVGGMGWNLILRFFCFVIANFRRVVMAWLSLPGL